MKTHSPNQPRLFIQRFPSTFNPYHVHQPSTEPAAANNSSPPNLARPTADAQSSRTRKASLATKARESTQVCPAGDELPTLLTSGSQQEPDHPQSE